MNVKKTIGVVLIVVMVILSFTPSYLQDGFKGVLIALLSCVVVTVFVVPLCFIIKWLFKD